MASSDTSIVSFEVDCMTDYQILFGAVVFKHLNTHPDVNVSQIHPSTRISHHIKCLACRSTSTR